jgi:hypothetical protein
MQPAMVAPPIHQQPQQLNRPTFQTIYNPGTIQGEFSNGGFQTQTMDPNANRVFQPAVQV